MLLDADGFLQEAEGLAPQLHERVLRLHDEQEDLLGELAEIDSRLVTARPAEVDGISEQLGRFLCRLREHEASKNQIVLEAFNVEPGAMD